MVVDKVHDRIKRDDGPSVGFDLSPRLSQDVLTVHLVVQRMEPPRRTRLRGSIQGSLEFSRLIWGGSSPSGTHQRLPPSNPQTKCGPLYLDGVLSASRGRGQRLGQADA